MTVLNIPFNSGTEPALDGSVSYAKLLNLVVTPDSRVSEAPFFTCIEKLHNPQGIYRTVGAHTTLIVADGFLYTVNQTHDLLRVGPIAVQTGRIAFAENLKNEVLLCTGKTAYVYNTDSNSLTDLHLVPGFDMERPISCTMINSYFIVADGNSNRWQISGPNDGLHWTPLDEALLTTVSTKILSVQSISNNLFLIGNNAIERWVPQETALDFPFSRDNNYRFAWGAFNTEAIAGYQDQLVFLSNQRKVMVLTTEGVKKLSTPGIDRRLSNLSASEKPVSVLFKHQGQLFYSLATSDETWLFSFASQRWSNSSDTLLQWDGQRGFLLEDGFYSASTAIQARHRQLQTGWLTLPARLPYKPVVHRVSLTIIFGVCEKPLEKEPLYLSVARNHADFGNRIPLRLPQRYSNSHTVHWPCHVVARELMLRLDYFGSSQITLTDCSVDIN